MDYKSLIEKAKTLKEIEDIRIQLLGKKGSITQQLKELSTLSVEEKKEKGKTLNVLKNQISQLIEEKKEILEEKNKQINTIDYSILQNKKFGNKHIITEAIELLHEIFQNIGFEFANGPDIELPYYNFDALNIPENHPSRDNHDTFYMHESNSILRTQGTAVQARLLEAMKDNPKDTRSYSIGRMYRNDSHDATHTCMFHQIEGIIIEDGVTMQHLKGFLEYLLQEFFEKKVKITFRPSFFPFTEPSCEVDIFTQTVNGKLEVAENGKPLELGGCGIIHPKILKEFNQEGKQSFAFGMGLERLIMIKHRISNIHTLYNNKIDELKYEKAK